MFSASPEAAEGEYDLLNLQVKITNDSKKIQNFALKGVFDTYFGEKTITHFSTKLNPIIVKEMNISNLAEYAWIKSSDSIRSVQFNFFSKANEPTQVRLANKDLLLVQDWDSNGLSGRSFNSVYSYNNSAIALYWPVKRLAYQGSSECRLSISFAQNGLLPFSKDPLAEEEKALEEEVCEEEKLHQTKKTKLETSVDDRSVQAENPYAYTKPITKEQLDTAYIEALLAKIEALENDDTNIDRTELLKLNAELDAILDMLRK